MSDFDTLEASVNQSRPLTLYRFDFGSEIFRFTNAPEDYVFGGTTYTAIAIRNSDPLINPKERRSTHVKIEVESTKRPFKDFLAIQPSAVLDVIIYRVQRDEVTDPSPIWASPQLPPNPTTLYQVFEGYAISTRFNDRTCELEFAPDDERLGREIPKFKFSGLCNHVLYDDRCALDENLFKQSGSITAISENTITVSGFTGTAFIGGYVTVGNEHRMILDQSTDVFTLLLPFRSATVGETANAFQGCDHTVVTCRDKFANVANFGGFPYVPGTNPFGVSQFTKV